MGNHNVQTHFLKDRICEICKRTKITRAPCRRRNGEAVLRAVNFGDLITADHKVLSDKLESRTYHRYAVVVQDPATQWIQAHPCKNKTSQETQWSLQKFLEPEMKPKVIYTDNSLEFAKACEDFSWNHCTSTPHRSETNGIAERAVRRVKEGTSAVLLQPCLNENWWAVSMECYTYLRNVTDLLSDGKTPCERRFGQPIIGPLIPFGSLVEYHPITAKDQSRIHQIGMKFFTWIVPRMRSLRVRSLEGWRTDCRPWGVGNDGRIGNLLEKTQWRKRWYFSKKENFFFQSQMDESKHLEENRNWEHPPWYGIDQFKERVTLIFLEKTEGSLPQPHDSLPVAGEAINDFWYMSGSFKNRHLAEHRVKLYSPREDSFPIPLRYIDVSRTIHTNLNVKQEKRTDDFCNIDGSIDFSDFGQVSLSWLREEKNFADWYLWFRWDWQDGS